PWHRTVADLDALLGVDPNDDACGAVDLAVDPHLTIVINIRFKKHARAGELNTIDLRRNFDGDAVPAKRKTNRMALPDVVAHFPLGVVIVRQARRTIEDLGLQTLVGLPWHQPRRKAPLALDLLAIFSFVEIQGNSWHMSSNARLVSSFAPRRTIQHT